MKSLIDIFYNNALKNIDSINRRTWSPSPLPTRDLGGTRLRINGSECDNRYKS